MPFRKRIVICSWYPVTDEDLALRTAVQGLASTSLVASIAPKFVAQVLASRAG
jgi:hypothetical protein